jgi:hypothetical protein
MLWRLKKKPKPRAATGEGTGGDLWRRNRAKRQSIHPWRTKVKAKIRSKTTMKTKMS